MLVKRVRRKHKRRIVNEKNLKKADSFRVQVQLKDREHKILWAVVYNWIAEEYPEVAERIIKNEEIADMVIKRLKQEFRTIIISDSKALDKHMIFRNEVLANDDINLRVEVDNIINKILSR